MSKLKFAGILAAGLVLAAGAANAAESAFPASVNETTPFSFAYEGMHYAQSGAVGTGTVFPSSVSEATAFSLPAEDRPSMAERRSRTYGSVFPSSVNETGGRL